MKLSFEKFNLVFFTAESLACFEPIKAARFLKKLEVHSVLCGQEKFVFKRQFSWMFSTFWLRRERKTTKFARFEIDFMLHHAMCSADVTCVNVSTVQLVLCELLLRINSWVFENKFSRNHLVNKPSRISPHEVLQSWLINTVYHLLVKNNQGRG